MSQTKKQTIPAIRHHQVTEKRSYQYNKLYSTIDLQYAITLHFEILRVFLDIPPLSIVGPSGTQSTSSSLPPNTSPPAPQRGGLPPNDVMTTAYRGLQGRSRCLLLEDWKRLAPPLEYYPFALQLSPHPFM